MEDSEKMTENDQKTTAPAEEAPKEKKQHSNLFVRCISVVVMLPCLLLLLFLGTPWMWATFILIVAFIGNLEYMRITNGDEKTSTRVVSAVLAILPATAAYLCLGDQAPMTTAHAPIILASAIALMLWGTFLFTCFRPREIPKASSVINATLGSSLYIGFTFLCIALLKRDFSDGTAWIMTLLCMTWFSDTGAYFVGRKFGKHKLAPILSPKKSVEGAIGGFVFALIAAVGAKFIAFPQIDVCYMLLLGVVANFLAQTGDLSESLIKRAHGVKDSGNIIPGHGGVLDRFDALIFSAPWVYGFAYFMN